MWSLRNQKILLLHARWVRFVQIKGYNFTQAIDKIGAVKHLWTTYKWFRRTWLSGIDWVITRGESGFNAKTMKEEWVLNIKRQCEIQDTTFFKNNGVCGEAMNWILVRKNGVLLGDKIYCTYLKFMVHETLC